MARPRLTVPLIVGQAIQLADSDSFEALSLSALAERLGVRPSALYNHVTGLDDLQYLVAVAATGNLTAAVRNAAVGTFGSRAVTAMGHAYRSFSLDHVGQFASTLLPPRSNHDDLTRENRHLLDVFVAVFAATGMAEHDSYLAARPTRSALHGFLAPEHNSGTTDAHGAESTHLLEALQRGLMNAGT